MTILTCHSSKGLEWPVVFIPEGVCLSTLVINLPNKQLLRSVVDGVHPHHMTEDIDEARSALEPNVKIIAQTQPALDGYFTWPAHAPNAFFTSHIREGK